MPHDRHVARVITGRAFLFEAVLVFLVDDDESQLAGRREDGAAGPHHHLNLPVGDASPLATPLNVGQVAVQHGHCAEAAAKSFDGLRSKADFRNQHERFFSLANHFLDGLEIDLGFAAAGHAVQ